jgi:membrane-bound lytic murein transglycosylase D
MRSLWLVALLLVSSLRVPGQDETVTLDDLVQSADQWAHENLDEDALRVLQDVDRERVKEFLSAIQKQFHGEYVVDLASLKDSAKAIVPLLESHEETQPYAAWLKTRLDYLEVADQLRSAIPPPKPEPGQPPRPAPNPGPEKEREVWVKKLAERPWPEAAKPYVPRLKPIFTGQKVPGELVWVAEVESAFDPRARSPAGAAGLYQLMPATARQYGLRTRLPDQRLRAEDNARAAAKHLQHLHAQFKDWRLALAAYNAGEGTVQKLLHRHNARTFDAIATHLPAETQMYVPKVEATLLRREGVKLDRLERTPGTRNERAGSGSSRERDEQKLLSSPFGNPGAMFSDSPPLTFSAPRFYFASRSGAC